MLPARAILRCFTLGMAVPVVVAIGAGCDGSTSGSDLRPLRMPAFSGGFTDLTAPIEAHPPFDIGQITAQRFAPESTVGLFADLDNDGTAEVLISPTWLDSRSDGMRGTEVYHYDRTTAALVDAGLLGPFLSMGALDVDGDGFSDVLTLDRVLGVAFNRGDGTLGDAVSLDRDPFMAQYGIVTMTLTDLDRDGWLDILQSGSGPDVGGIQPMIRVGPREWRNRVDLMHATVGSGPNALLDIDFDAGRLLMAVGQQVHRLDESAAFFMQDGVDSAGYPTFVAFDPLPATTYYNHPGDEAQFAPLNKHAPMGAAIGDLDGDGRIDLFVAIDPVHQIFGGTSSWPLTDRTAESGFAEVPGERDRAMLAWGVSPVDIDLDGLPDMVAAHGNDVGAWIDGSIGPQWTTVHWNIDGTRFLDVSHSLGIDRHGQFESLSIGDLDGDGDADLAVGGMGELPRIYRNDVVTENHGFTLRLRGTTSNHLGVGARVTVQAGDGPHTQVFAPSSVASPYALPEPMVFVGIGKYTSARAVDIHWPSGTLQTLHDVPTGGVITVTEPPSISLDVPSRHVPADGVSAVMVTVSPRNPDGTLRTDAHIELALRYGDARIDGPAEVTASGMRFRVVAPTAPGSTVVTVTVDGTPMGISPRIFWDEP